jgi:RimJ/RimL family protein N-acetyltransferase
MTPLVPPAHATLIAVPDLLEGERVLLRPFTAEDAPALYAAIDESRQHLTPWMDWAGHHRSVDDTRDYCLRTAAKRLLRTDLTYGIFDRADGRVLGGTGFHEPNWTRRSFEVGYWLRPSAEGRGFVTESVRLLVDLAFGRLHARRVELWCDANNERSRRVAERCGFVLEGRLRNRTMLSGVASGDSLVFSLIPGDPAVSALPPQADDRIELR